MPETATSSPRFAAVTYSSSHPKGCSSLGEQRFLLMLLSSAKSISFHPFNLDISQRRGSKDAVSPVRTEFGDCSNHPALSPHGDLSWSKSLSDWDRECETSIHPGAYSIALPSQVPQSREIHQHHPRYLQLSMEVYLWPQHLPTAGIACCKFHANLTPRQTPSPNWAQVTPRQNLNFIQQFSTPLCHNVIQARWSKQVRAQQHNGEMIPRKWEKQAIYNGINVDYEFHHRIRCPANTIFGRDLLDFFAGRRVPQPRQSRILDSIDWFAMSRTQPSVNYGTSYPTGSRTH